MARADKDRNASADSGIKRRLDCDHAHNEPMLVRAKRRRTLEKRQITKPMKFVSLHHHSTFSSLDGFQMPEAHVRRATELNMGALAMTEHGNVSSHDALELACKDMGVKPIYGCEVYTGPVGEKATQRKYHLTILAKDLVGYSNLLQLVSRSWKEGYYYEPTVSWDMLKQHKEGLVILSGCQGSLLFCSAVGGKLVAEADASYARARKVARAFKREFGENYFIEVQAFPELEKTRQFNPMAEKLGKDLGIGLVATMDCHYTVPEEQEIQMVLHNVRGGGRQTLEEQVRNWGYDEYLCPPPTDISLYRRLIGTGLSHKAALEAVVNTENVNSGIKQFDLPTLPMLEYPLPEGYDDHTDLLWDWVKQGWEFRDAGNQINNLSESRKARMRREMKMIIDKGYQSYFLVVADAVQFAKNAGIPVGPARGSAAGSYVCWLLRITEVNPMLYPNLVFERFIDISRDDMPDIDLDFDSDRRHEVREYLVAKYGEECVNNIGTFQYYKSKNSLDDVARVYNVPTWKINTVKDLLLERSSGDLRASATIEDTVGQFEEARDVFQEHPELYQAMQLEGNIKGIGVHSAGLVVSNGPITDVCAVYERNVKGVPTAVVSLDKHDAERRGLIKIDVLGLSTMAMLAEALRLLDMNVQDLYDLPLDDEKVIDGFRKNDVVGIFQFDGRAMRQVNASLKPDSFKEICDVNALSRPGPLHNGAANEYIDIKRGVKQAERIHPLMDAITADTHYQLVYQEQILRVVVEIGGFDWTAASYIRKIMSKKHGEAEFNRHWARFWEGAQKNAPDMSEGTARRIWGACITAGAYAFNAAHCVSYGMLAYWTMWLKQYHPAVFYAASLMKMPAGKAASAAGASIGQRHVELMRDTRKYGRTLKIRPPHPVDSRKDWGIADGDLQAGFKQIPKVGDVTADSIVTYRDEHELATWDDLINVKGIGPKTLENIQEFVQSDDPFGVYRIDRAIEEVKKLIASEDGKKAGLPMPTHIGTDIPYERGKDQIVVWAGEIKTRNLRDIFESNRARTGIELKPSEVDSPEMNEFMLMLGYDGHDLVSLRFNRFIYPQHRDAIWSIKPEHDIVLIRGVKPGWRTAREIYVEDMWVIEP